MLAQENNYLKEASKFYYQLSQEEEIRWHIKNELIMKGSVYHEL